MTYSTSLLMSLVFFHSVFFTVKRLRIVGSVVGLPFFIQAARSEVGKPRKLLA